jgi:molybdopterin converting factor small subunit|tara:strand:+ start:11881 stop:12099 length:219 start_codon:yes stop_codon:yes gene_type:complete
MATKTIKFLQGGGFVEKQTNADTVEQLRAELPDDISASSSIAVNGISVTNTHAINDGDIVAAVNNNKSGGDQ